MEGRAVITGATGSMGAAACKSLAAKGVPVLMACRNLRKAEDVRDGILRSIPAADLQIRQLDLSSMASVQAFTDGIRPGDVSAVFHNAGVICKDYGLTQDGLENTFSVNYFGPMLLTLLLLPKLPQDARIVSMVSLSCRYVTLSERDLLPAAERFSQLGSYARSKRALMSFSLELARRYPGLRVNLADPGIVATDIIDLGHWYDPLTDVIFKPFCKKPMAGVQPALRALEAADGPRYYVGKDSRAIPARYIDPALDARIWEASESILSKYVDSSSRRESGGSDRL